MKETAKLEDEGVRVEDEGIYREKCPGKREMVFVDRDSVLQHKNRLIIDTALFFLEF